MKIVLGFISKISLGLCLGSDRDPELLTAPLTPQTDRPGCSQPGEVSCRWHPSRFLGMGIGKGKGSVCSAPGFALFLKASPAAQKACRYFEVPLLRRHPQRLLAEQQNRKRQIIAASCRASLLHIKERGSILFRSGAACFGRVKAGDARKESRFSYPGIFPGCCP